MGLLLSKCCSGGIGSIKDVSHISKSATLLFTAYGSVNSELRFVHASDFILLLIEMC